MADNREQKKNGTKSVAGLLDRLLEYHPTVERLRSIDTDFQYLKDTWHGALGMQYRIAKPWLLSLGLAYEYINAGSSSINKKAGLLVGDLVGDYSPNMINVVNVNLIYKL